MPSAFNSSVSNTLGVELEFDIIDRADSRRLPIASAIGECVAPEVVRGTIAPDLFESILEISTGVCSSIDEVGRDLRASLDLLAPHLERHDAALLGMGLHPFALADDAVVTAKDRYLEIMSNLEWPARQVTTCALQIHVGMPSGDVAVSTARHLRSVLPVVLALSASSPFHNGIPTGLASTRTALFAAVPRSGPMPDFRDWQAYASYCETMANAGAMPSMLSTWWDCRPQPTLGTLELRIADAVPELDDALALCSLLWCLTVGVDHLSNFQIPTLLSDENRWRALRFGWRARFLDADGDTSRTLSENVEQLLDTLEPIADELGCTGPLQRCVALSRGEGRHQLPIAPDHVTSPDRNHELALAAASQLRVSW